MNKVTLVTGGSRSGKSRYALELAQKYSKRVFIATAEPIDSEMQDRIKNHKEERGKNYLLNPSIISVIEKNRCTWLSIVPQFRKTFWKESYLGPPKDLTRGPSINPD